MLPAWQPQIESASTHKEIIAVLRSFGLDAIADRLNYLIITSDGSDHPHSGKDWEGVNQHHSTGQCRP